MAIYRHPLIRVIETLLVCQCGYHREHSIGFA